jgi:hypothetical protein
MEEVLSRPFPSLGATNNSGKMCDCSEISCKVFARGKAPDSGVFRAWWFPVRGLGEAEKCFADTRNTASSIKDPQEQESGLWQLY